MKIKNLSSVMCAVLLLCFFGLLFLLNPNFDIANAKTNIPIQYKAESSNMKLIDSTWADNVGSVSVYEIKNDHNNCYVVVSASGGASIFCITQ
jgi:hypothetical protein